jgi:hypothetical protein
VKAGSICQRSLRLREVSARGSIASITRVGPHATPAMLEETNGILVTGLFGSRLLAAAVVVIVVVSLVLGLVGLLDTVADVVVHMLLWHLTTDLFIQLLESF